MKNSDSAELKQLCAAYRVALNRIAYDCLADYPKTINAYQALKRIAQDAIMHHNATANAPESPKASNLPADHSEASGGKET